MLAVLQSFKWIIYFFILCYSYQSLSSEWPSENIARKNYFALQIILPIYENAITNPWATIPSGVKLKPGVKNLSVLTLRGHLIITRDLQASIDDKLTVYDKKVTEAVKRFQVRHGLKADGIVGPSTLYQLNIPPEMRLQQILINIDRWAKLANQLDRRYIMINIPDFHLEVIEDGKSILSMKAIVGKTDRPTPEITSKITRMVLNPYWNIPKLIIEKDIIPKIIADPNYLEIMKIKIFDRLDDYAYQIPSHEIDWDFVQYEGFPYQMRQDPGVKNALGLIKFEFANSKDIYMHDTPAKYLFKQDKLAYSSGCLRIEKPFELAEYLMIDDSEWNEQQITEWLAAQKPKYIKITHPIQIFITYLTTWVDENGILQFRDDLYGLDEVQSPS